MKIKRIGMRTVKTALAVSITLFISQMLKLKSPFFAGIAAITAMQTSVSESFIMAKNRMYGTILGGIIALLFSYLAPENILSIGVGIIILIYICNLFNLDKTIQLSTMVFLSIIINYEGGGRLTYAFYRTIDTLIGLVVGTFINYFVLPYKVENKAREAVNNMYAEVMDMLKSLIWQEENRPLDNLKAHLSEVEKGCSILKNDIKLNSRKTLEYDRYIWVFNSFERIYHHLSIIFAIETIPQLTRGNKEALEGLFDMSIPLPSYDRLEEQDLVYNYHLEKLLLGLDSIKDLLSDSQTEVQL